MIHSFTILRLVTAFRVLGIGNAILLLFIAFVGRDLAQELAVTGMQIGTDQRPSIAYAANSNYYYLLVRGNTPTTITLRVSAALFATAYDTLNDPAAIAATHTAFYKVPGVPLAALEDSTVPYLFIDFPTDGMVMTASYALAAGRIGDALGGFLGLSVTVNGQAADTLKGTINIRAQPFNINGATNAFNGGRLIINP